MPKLTHTLQLAKKTLLFLSILLLTSCATESYRTTGFDYSAEDIQKAIQDNMPTGISMTTPNIRGFYSRVITQEEKKGKIFLVMLINILGDGRPYDLEVIVHRVDSHLGKPAVAFSEGGAYVGQDSLAKRVVAKINAQLVKRRKERNMFDDFRPF